MSRLICGRNGDISGVPGYDRTDVSCGGSRFHSRANIFSLQQFVGLVSGEVSCFGRLSTRAGEMLLKAGKD